MAVLAQWKKQQLWFHISTPLPLPVPAERLSCDERILQQLWQWVELVCGFCTLLSNAVTFCLFCVNAELFQVTSVIK